MLTTLALLLAVSTARIAAQTLPPNDHQPRPQTVQMLLPTVPPDQVYPVLQTNQPLPLVVPTVPTMTASQTNNGGGVAYEHSISLGPNSNYYVYYSDNAHSSHHHQQQQQQPPQHSRPSLSYQPLVGFPNEQSSQIVFNPNIVPVQLVTLVQPTIDAALQQENATDAATAEAAGQEQASVNINEEGIQKLVSSTQDLVTNEDVVSINNAEEDAEDKGEQQREESVTEKAESDSVPSESQNKEKLTDNLAVPSFNEPIVVGEMPDSAPRSHRGSKIDNLFKQINVEIIGEGDDHNKGQFLKETTYLANQITPEPCDDDHQSTPLLIKHEVTTIRPVPVTAKLRGTTASRLITRYRTTPVANPVPTAQYTETFTVTPKPVSNQYLAPIQAGLRLSHVDKNVDDCDDTKGEKTLVEVQKSINIKNILVNQDQPIPTRHREFGARTKVIPQPIIIEKPVDRIIKQNVFIEKPVERIVPQPIYIEKPVPHHVDRIVEKKVPVPYPVEKIVEKPVPTAVPVPYPVEKHIPVHHYIDRPVTKHVTVEVPVAKIIEKQVPVEKIITKEVPVPYPVTQIVDRPYPVEVPVEKIVEKIIDRPVEKVVEKHVEVPVPVTVEKVVEKFIDRPVPYAVQVPIEVPVQVPVHYPVEIPVGVPIPYPVEKLVPVTIHEPPKPTHAIIKTTTHTHDKLFDHKFFDHKLFDHKLFDFTKLFGGKKKHYVEHIYLKAPPLSKPPVVEVPTKQYFHNPYPKNDLHFGASIAAPSYIDVAQVNILPHHFPDKPKPIYNVPLAGDVIIGKHYNPQFSIAPYPPLIDHSNFVGKFTYPPQQPPQTLQHQFHQQQPLQSQLIPHIYKDDYVGPTPLLEDHWAVKSDVKFRRNAAYGKSLRIEYGGFKPPLVPSLEIDENGVPLNKEQQNAK